MLAGKIDGVGEGIYVDSGVVTGWGESCTSADKEWSIRFVKPLNKRYKNKQDKTPLNIRTI